MTPQLVHRLDKDTSGVLLIAKDESTAAEPEAIFAEGRDVEKEYLCLVAGRLQDNQGRIDFTVTRPGRRSGASAYAV